MDVIANFFTKLRNLAVNLEKETRYLDRALNNESDIEDEAPKKILHELHSEVRNIKAGVQKKIETLDTESKENRELIRAFQILQQKSCAEIEEIEEHFQNYGYEPLHRKDEEPQMKLMNTGIDGTENSEPEHEEQSDEVVTPSHEKPLLNDPLRTPQLEDFGLGHLMFQNAWGKPECILPSDSKIAESYDMHSSTLQGLVIPKTPKCTLQLDDDDMLLTPKLEHFGITEHTGCVNDFTLALYNKCAQSEINSCIPIPTAEEDPWKTSVSKQNESDVSVSCVMHQPDPNTGDMLNSPLPPVFCTPGLKIYKDFSQVPAEEERKSNGSVPSPILPHFETPWLKKQSTCQYFKNEENTAPVEKTATNGFSLEEPQPPVVGSENSFLNGCSKSPTPPLMMTDCGILLDTPKAPEMTTQITADVLKILSSFDANLRTHDVRYKFNRQNLTSVDLMTPLPRNRSEKENRK